MTEPADVPTERQQPAPDLPTERGEATGDLPTAADLAGWPAQLAPPGAHGWGGPPGGEEPVIDWPDVVPAATRWRTPALIVAAAVVLAAAILVLRLVSG